MSALSRRILLISDFNLENLRNCLAADESEPKVTADCAPFGEVYSVLLDPSAAVWRNRYDAVLVWTRPQSVIPSFQKVLDYDPSAAAQIETEVDSFAACLAKATAQAAIVLAPTWVISPVRHGLGLLEFSPGGAAFELAKMNLRLSERLPQSEGCYVLDSRSWLDAAGGASAHSTKLWGLTKTPFHIKCFQQAAEEIKAALRAVQGRGRKLLVLDLDDTLWGGMVGEVGWRHLRLGGHDPIGEALVEFQRALSALKNRGVVLAVVSKNNEAIALEAIDEHPAMVLRRGDFVGWRINWEDKAKNIRDLAEELNLGLDSVVFIDDSPAERARVRSALPEVLVPEWPKDKTQYSAALAALHAFDSAHLSDEDRQRTELYAAERQRTRLRTSVSSAEEWLSTLEVTALVAPLEESNIKRAAQLLNKTNQMNLSTRRLTEAELRVWARGEGRGVWCLSVSDRFGDAGLTGLVSLEKRGPACAVVDFVLSCRVFGRRIEQAMTAILVEEARALGAETLEATFEPTQKNEVCLEYWRSSGFSADAAGRTFAWDLRQDYPAGRLVRIVRPSPAPHRRAA